jgi:hypothetical protein
VHQSADDRGNSDLAIHVGISGRCGSAWRSAIVALRH